MIGTDGLIDLGSALHHSYRRGVLAVSALGLSAGLVVGMTAGPASGRDAAAETVGAGMRLPHLVAGHDRGSACPKAAAGLPESRGRTLHASVAGQGDGESEASPIALAWAVSLAQPGDTILLAPGDYGELSWPAGLHGDPDNPITLRAAHPAVRLTGEAPELIAEPAAPELFSRVSLALHDVRHVRIDGIYGRIETHEVAHLEFSNNYHHGNDGQNLLLTEGSDVSVHGSLIENFELRPGYTESWLTDYGIANYDQKRVSFHNNHFNGGFNHAISLKTSNADVTISCNRFSNCGRHCLELGQQTDGKLPDQEPTDRTSERVLIKNNLFEVTDETYVNADYAVMIMNVDDVVLEDNRFTGIFRHSILLSSYWEPTYCSSTGEAMSQIGIQPDFVRIQGNHFEGETNIRVTGRGVAGDRLEIGEVSGGPVSCELMDLAPITCEDSCCRWEPSPDDEGPPAIHALDGSITCR